MMQKVYIDGKIEIGDVQDLWMDTKILNLN